MKNNLLGGITQDDMNMQNDLHDYFMSQAKVNTLNYQPILRTIVFELKYPEKEVCPNCGFEMADVYFEGIYFTSVCSDKFFF